MVILFIFLCFSVIFNYFLYKKNKDLKNIVIKIGDSFSNFGYNKDYFKKTDEGDLIINKNSVQIIKTVGLYLRDIEIKQEDFEILINKLKTSAHGEKIERNDIEVLASLYHKRLKIS